MTQKVTVTSNQNGATAVAPPHPEVVPKAERRIFTASYKQRILAA